MEVTLAQMSFLQRHKDTQEEKVVAMRGTLSALEPRARLESLSQEYKYGSQHMLSLNLLRV